MLRTSAVHSYLFNSLPASKQVCVFSATYPPSLDETLQDYMRSPTMVRSLARRSALVAQVRFDTDDVQLLGIQQYVRVLVFTRGDAPLTYRERSMELKVDALVELLARVAYTQCVVARSACTRADASSTATTWTSASSSTACWWRAASMPTTCPPASRRRSATHSSPSCRRSRRASSSPPTW